MLKFGHRLLENPKIYQGFLRAVIGDAYRRLVDAYVQPRFGERLLDIGCGTGDFIEYLEGCDYVGFDLNPGYIETARGRYGDRGDFRCGSVAEDRWPFCGEFDIATAVGVVHHLNDAEARQLFTLAARALKPGGRLITYDGCYVLGQPLLARVVVSMDRGRFVRTAEAYRDLAATAFSTVEQCVHHDLIRIPYTHLIQRITGPVGSE